MAKEPKTFATLIELTTTAAMVDCSNKRFENAEQAPDPDFITLDMVVKFNGRSNEIAPTVTFGRLATSGQRQAAVRAVVNAHLAQSEPEAGALSNADITIDGLGV